ncbi:hypothetical protein B0H12DRAFT_1238138 [Mycena haematopus]|nr:hypothetical protein B0H12DRAFT_1238138 [Mycena haematopus]
MSRILHSALGAVTTTPLFGAQPAAPTPLFGAQPAAPTPLFGAQPATAVPAGGAFSFGGNTTSTVPASTFGAAVSFGAPPQQQQQFSFGATAALGAAGTGGTGTGFLFGGRRVF